MGGGRGRGCVWQGVCVCVCDRRDVCGMGVCVAGGACVEERRPLTATEAGGKHPTGMHSCN